MPSPHTIWHWQEAGTAWKGVGIYHVTLTIPSRQPLLGTLVIPDNDPAKAIIDESPLAKDVVKCLLHIYEYHPEVQVLRFCVMPDHLHAILHVRQTMPVGIKTVVRGFWQAAKKIGRAYSSANCLSIAPNTIRDNTPPLSDPIFTEMPFIRPLSRRGQLQTMMHYVKMNPQRLATKRLMPGYFRVQRDIEIADRKYDGVGNVALLNAPSYTPVHVRRTMVEAAEHGNNQPLRDYMNGCVIAARKGDVMVSPFISPKEKEVLEVLLREKLPFIYLSDNGFGEYYKPSNLLFDACAEGQVLILSPWQHDAGKRHITRAECVALNGMAEEICNIATVPPNDIRNNQQTSNV